MFNLIISIIAIALVVALAGASLYYGGDAFSSGSSEARAATYINQAQQIQAAATLFEVTNGGQPANIAALVGDFIAAVPVLATGAETDGGQPVWDVTNQDDVVHVALPVTDLAAAGITSEICDLINQNGSQVVFCKESTGDLSVDAIPGAPVPADADAAALFDDVVVYMAL
jgi:hypothetical protein